MFKTFMEFLGTKVYSEILHAHYYIVPLFLLHSAALTVVIPKMNLLDNFQNF